MRVERNLVIAEIVRTAEQNNGKPLGQRKFETETGIKVSDWKGKHWTEWSDALAEAGYEPNILDEGYDEEALIIKLIDLAREIGRFPSSADLKLKAYNQKPFPSDSTFGKLGNQKQKAVKVFDYCRNRDGFSDILEICLPLLGSETESVENEVRSEAGALEFVYLMKSGKYYKIGRSNHTGRRSYDIGLILPEEIEVVHEIKTDDAAGIEEYWHKRFKDKRKKGEWFDLTRHDVEIFKRRKFM